MKPECPTSPRYQAGGEDGFRKLSGVLSARTFLSALGFRVPDTYDSSANSKSRGGMHTHASGTHRVILAGAGQHSGPLRWDLAALVGGEALGRLGLRAQEVSRVHLQKKPFRAAALRGLLRLIQLRFGAVCSGECH